MVNRLTENYLVDPAMLALMKLLKSLLWLLIVKGLKKQQLTNPIFSRFPVGTLEGEAYESASLRH